MTRHAAAIAALILAPLSGYVEFLTNLNVSVDPILSVAARVTAFLAFVFTQVAATYYLGRLAMRIPDEDLAQRSRVTARDFAIWLSVALVTLILLQVYRPLKEISWIADVVLLVSSLVLLVSVLLFLNAAFSLIGIWWTYRKVFKHCLIEARKNESEYPIGPPAHSARAGNAVIAPSGAR